MKSGMKGGIPSVNHHLQPCCSLSCVLILFILIILSKESAPAPSALTLTAIFVRPGAWLTKAGSMRSNARWSSRPMSSAAW